MQTNVSKLTQLYAQGRISRRTFLRGSIALGLSMSTISALLTACEPAATEQPTAAPTAVPTTATPVPPTATPKPKEPVVLQAWSWTPASPTLEACKADFASKFPGLSYEVVDRGSAATATALGVSLASGQDLPDVALVLQEAMDMFMDGLTDVTSIVEKYKDDFPAAPLAAGARGGRYFGMPTDIVKSWVYYRRDKFEEVGVKAEDIITWDDYIAAGKELTIDRNGDGVPEQYMMELNHPSEATEWRMWAQMFFAGRGGTVFDPETGKVIRNNEMAVETLQWWGDLYHKHKIATLLPFATPSWMANLNEGITATLCLPTWGLGQLKAIAPDLAGKWGIMPWPLWAKDAPPYCGVEGGSLYVVPKAAPHPEEALKLLEYICTDPVAMQNTSLYQGIPAYEPALATSPLNNPDDYYGGQILMDVYNQRQLPISPKWHYVECTKVGGPELQAFMEGQKTAADAWKAIEGGLIALGFG